MVLRDRVIDALRQTQGNVAAALLILDGEVSERYVFQIKRDLGKDFFLVPLTEQDGTLLPPNQIPLSQSDAIKALMPSNIPAMVELRDAALNQLTKRVRDDLDAEGLPLSVDELTKILTVVLRYETRLNEILQPVVGIYNQTNIQQNNYGDLDKKLADIPLDDLKDQLGIPRTIDVTNFRRKEND